MNLKELHKHRTDFTIIELTGRTGSGCIVLQTIEQQED